MLDELAGSCVDKVCWSCRVLCRYSSRTPYASSSGSNYGENGRKHQNGRDRVLIPAMTHRFASLLGGWHIQSQTQTASSPWFWTQRSCFLSWRCSCQTQIQPNLTKKCLLFSKRWLENSMQFQWCKFAWPGIWYRNDMWSSGPQWQRDWSGISVAAFIDGHEIWLGLQMLYHVLVQKM